MKSTRRLNSVGEMLKNAIYSALFRRTKKIYNTIIRYFTTIKKSQSIAQIWMRYTLFYVKIKSGKIMRGKIFFFWGRYANKKNLSNNFFPFCVCEFGQRTNIRCYGLWKVKALKFKFSPRIYMQLFRII